MKVLFWVDQFWPAIGGVEVWSMRLLRALQARGYELLVLTSRTGVPAPDDEVLDGMRIVRLPFWTALNSGNPGEMLAVRRSAAHVLREWQPEVVHLNMCGPTLWFYMVTRDVHRCPALFTLHGQWPDNYAQPGSLLAQLVTSADRVTAVSRQLLDWLVGFVPEVRERATVVHNAVRETTRAAPQPLPAAPSVLCLGRLSHEKGFDVALEAFSRVLRRIPQACLRVAGDGLLRAELEALAVRLEIGSRVEFLGWVDPGRVGALLDGCSLLLVPSRREGFGLVVLEAAQRARMTLATRVGGLPELIVEGQTGRLVPPEDPQSMANELSSLLGNPDELARLGESSRTTLMRRFDFEAHVDSYSGFYRALLPGNAHAAGGS